MNKRFRTCGEFARALGYNGEAPAPANPPSVAQASLAPTGARLVTETGQIIPIPGADFLVTRALLGGHASVSRQHARIVFQRNQYWLRDEKSTNGTWRNGQRVLGDWTPLQPNDMVVFGHVTLRFLAGP